MSNVLSAYTSQQFVTVTVDRVEVARDQRGPNDKLGAQDKVGRSSCLIVLRNERGDYGARTVDVSEPPVYACDQQGEGLRGAWIATDGHDGIRSCENVSKLRVLWPSEDERKQ